MISVAIYILTAAAFLIAAYGVYQTVKTLKASDEYRRALSHYDDVKCKLNRAVRLHAKRKEIRAELTRAMADLLRIEGKIGTKKEVKNG